MRLRAGLFVMVMMMAAPAPAATITYLGDLLPGVPVFGDNDLFSGEFDVADGADYWRIFGTAGTVLDIVGSRLDPGYDMAFWVFRGLFSDTNQFGADINQFDAGFVGFFDDQLLPNLPGPGGDPRARFVAPVTGFYTIIVTNSLSDVDPPNSYSLLATVPEPTTFVLIGTGCLGLAARARRAWRTNARGRP